MSHTLPQDVLSPSDVFIPRHIGPSEADIQKMVALLGYRALDELLDATVPASIRLNRRLDLGPPRAEHETLAELRGIAQKNELYRSLIGLGYHDTIAPPVILRNILCNPGWYTQYTPYQAEISQGRLEALLTFQTVVADLTGLPLANASLLDEATAAAEAMTMAPSHREDREDGLFRRGGLPPADHRGGADAGRGAGHPGARRQGARHRLRKAEPVRNPAAVSDD